MKTITTSIRIDAPAETIWTILTDAGRYAEWNPFVTQLDGRLAIGERLRVRIAPPGAKGMSFRPVVTHFVPERELAWVGTLGVRGLFDGAHSFRVDPLHDDGCLFTQAESFTGLLVPLLSGTLSKTEEGFELLNQALRDRAEAMALR